MKLTSMYANERQFPIKSFNVMIHIFFPFTTPQNITVLIILQIVFIALDHKDNCKFPVLASPSKMRGVSFLIGSKKFLIAEIDHKNICSDNPLVYNIKNIYELTIYIFLCVSQKYLGIMEEKLRINKMILKTKIQLKFQQFAHISVYQQTTRVFFIANLILVNQLQKKNK